MKGHPLIQEVEASRLGSILVVDDLESLGLLIRDALEHEGYQVLLATSGARALELASSTKGTLDLLLTDVEMPDMNGFQLAAALRISRPKTRVLFMSGREWRGEIADRHFLPKPFRVDELLDRVRKILRSKSHF